MRKFILPLVFVLPLSIFCQIPESKEIDEIFTEWNKPETPGAALGIVKDGKLIYSKGYGYGDLEHDLEITPSSVFYIGSVSKQFVTFTVLLLEEQGKIGLDDKIQKYLPDFPEYESPLTIRHFIHHTSGVRDYLTLMYLKGRSYLDHIEEEQVYELIKSQEELNFTPGEKYLYSNSCYFMLAMIIEKAAGESLREFARKNMFEPLGMKNTLFYDDNRDLIKNKVFSYEPREDGGFNNLILRFDLVGSGGVYSSVEDLLLWDQNFYDNKLGKGGQDIINKMHEEGLLNDGTSSGYAFALNNGEYKGLKTVSHGGALAGYRAQLMRFPDQNFSVIILANRGDANPTGMSFQVADILLKEYFKEEPKEDSAVKSIVVEKKEATISFDQAIGSYQIQPGVIAEISVKNDSLHVLQKWNNVEYNIYRTTGDTYEIPNNSTVQFVFSDVKNDNAQILTVIQNGNPTECKRVNVSRLSEVDLLQYIGEYYSKEIDATYKVFKEGDKLMVKVPNNNAQEMELSETDLFVADGNVIRFKREGDLINGCEVDAGRVQNLKFVKK